MINPVFKSFIYFSHGDLFMKIFDYYYLVKYLYPPFYFIF